MGKTKKLIKKQRLGGTWYCMYADFKYGFVYTDILQFSLRKPWLIPKYEDNFGGIKGLRLCGWLFLYFGRMYNGSLFPAEVNENEGGFLDKNGKRWFIMPAAKDPDFEKNRSKIKKHIDAGESIAWERTYLKNGLFNVIVRIKSRNSV